MWVAGAWLNRHIGQNKNRMERQEFKTDLVLYRNSGIHGFGGFALSDMPAGTRVAEYLGEKINKEESLRRCEADNAYIFHFDDEYDLDGNVGWNPARFLNHSCAPNCEAEWDEDRIWIVTLRDIRVGEELTFNYGYDLEDYREHLCHCGAGNCVGYIVAEEFFETVSKASGDGAD
jgi:SET domain-containing protein